MSNESVKKMRELLLERITDRDVAENSINFIKSEIRKIEKQEYEYSHPVVAVFSTPMELCAFSSNLNVVYITRPENLRGWMFDAILIPRYGEQSELSQKAIALLRMRQPELFTDIK